jgi:hypothetical protein
MNNFKNFRIRSIARVLCGFPILVLASFYSTWVAGRLRLEHWPRPSFDDPKDIGGIFVWFYGFTYILLFIGIPLFLLFLLGQFLIYSTSKPDGWKNRLIELMAAAGLFVGLLLFAKWDPQSVIRWFFD